MKNYAFIAAMLCTLFTLVSCGVTGRNAKPTQTATHPPTALPTGSAAKERVPAYTKTTLEIERRGKIYTVLLGYDIGNAHFHLTPTPSYDIDQLYGDSLNMSAANLEWYSDVDQDGEQEYFLTGYGRGAMAYEVLLAVDYDAVKDEYRIFDRFGFRASCFDGWEDIEKDGIPEVMAKNEDFQSPFGSGADSAFSPLMILRYNGQTFIEVTKEYPDLIEKDANHWLELIENDALGQGQFTSIYAAYLADMTLLGKQEEGIQIYSKQCRQRLYTDSSDSQAKCDTLLERIKQAINEKR